MTILSVPNNLNLPALKTTTVSVKLQYFHQDTRSSTPPVPTVPTPVPTAFTWTEWNTSVSPNAHTTRTLWGSPIRCPHRSRV